MTVEWDLGYSLDLGYSGTQSASRSPQGASSRDRGRPPGQPEGFSSHFCPKHFLVIALHRSEKGAADAAPCWPLPGPLVTCLRVKVFANVFSVLNMSCRCLPVSAEAKIHVDEGVALQDRASYRQKYLVVVPRGSFLLICVTTQHGA